MLPDLELTILSTATARSNCMARSLSLPARFATLQQQRTVPDIRVDETHGGSGVRPRGEGSRLQPGFLKRGRQLHDHLFATGGRACEHVAADPTTESATALKIPAALAAAKPRRNLHLGIVPPTFSQHQDRAADWSARPVCARPRSLSLSPPPACYGGALSRRSVRQRLLGAGQQWRYRSATLPRRCPLVTTDGPRGLRPQSMPALLRAPDHAIRCPDLHERTLSTLACRVGWPAVSMLRVSGWAVGRWPPATSPVEKTTLSGRSGGPR